MAMLLLVESEPAVHAAVRTILESHGYGVVAVHTAEQARKVLRRTPPPDAVLIDMVLTDESGLALCRAIREHPPLGAMPVLLLCGRCRRGDRDRAEMAGADAFFTLPFDERAVVKWLQQHRIAA